jgi:RNA polymerase sigma factor (TIGR02999 family)
MASSSPGRITALLQAWSHGSRDAGDELFRALYKRLRRRAAGHLQRARAGHSLDPTDLVNEAYLRVAQQANVSWQNRAQFLAVAARIMRRVLVDHTRARLAAKRPEGRVRITLDEGSAAVAASQCDVIALDQALAELEGFDPRQSQIVVLRYLGGLTVEETAHVLAVSVATIKREWKVAKAWLHRRLAPAPDASRKPVKVSTTRP